MLLSVIPLVGLVPFTSAAVLYLQPGYNTHYAGPDVALSRHLGLDAFQPSPSLETAQLPFVASSPGGALFVTVEDADAKTILSFPPSIDVAISKSSISSLIQTLVDRAGHSYSSIYRGTEDIPALSTFFATAEAPSFAAIDLSRLAKLRLQYGTDHPSYTEVSNDIRNLFEDLVKGSETFHLAVLAYSPFETHTRRDPPQSPLPPPHEPLGSVSTCFTSVDICRNSTNSCSGRGQCVEATKSGRSCYICACGVTKSGHGNNIKTDKWAGTSCERKDISGPFALLTGTVVVLILLAAGAVSLLSTVGDSELPSTLLATAVQGKRE